MEKKILIVSYHFAPQNVIGAVRPTKLAKYLSRMGYRVTVLCGAGYGAAGDPILARDLAELPDVHIVHERSLLRWWKERGRTAEAPKALGERAKLPQQALSDAAMQAQAARALAENEATRAAAQRQPPSKPAGPRPRNPSPNQVQPRKRRLLDALYLWLAARADAAFARACVRKAGELGQTYDVVLSSYGPHSAHTVARQLKQQRVAGRWIADFRDEVTMPFPWQTGKRARYLRGVRRHADAIMAVSNGFLQMMALDAFGQVMPNGFDREDARGLAPFSPEKDRLVFAYCGQLHEGVSDLSPVFAALQALAQEGMCDLSRIRVHYAGRQGDVLTRQAERFGLARTVVDHGMLSRADSLALQRGADVLLAATWNTAQRKGVVTGKLLEYLMADKPIVCCISGELADSEAAALLAQTQAGVAYAQSQADRDAPRLRAYLASLYTARFSGGGSPYRPDCAAIEAFSYESIAHRVAKVIENV